jgi:hypothetical protein
MEVLPGADVKRARRQRFRLRIKLRARAAISGHLESSAVLVALLLRDRLTP